tara:strand:- start:1422 stop:1655 length:234 start_codon:yes stop_codon:yes gene_type:complete
MRIFLVFLILLLIVLPFELHAGEIDSSINEIEPTEIVEDPNQMTQEEINDLFGEDPYLGQTSYLQSPDGFSQRKISK